VNALGEATMKKTAVLIGVFSLVLTTLIPVAGNAGVAGDGQVPAVKPDMQPQPAAPEPASAPKPQEGATTAPAAPLKMIKEADLGLTENKTTTDQAVAKLKELGLGNVQVHRGAGDMGDIVSADGLDFMLRFGIFGYSGTIDLSDNLTPGASPRNYAVKIVPDGTVFITAEDFTLKFPGGKSKQGVLTCRWIENSMLTNQHDLSVLMRESGGFISPSFFMSIEGDRVILHARDAKGNDWQDGVAFSPDTGKVKGRVKWDDIKTELKL
jgi:hypothetical protein